MLLQDLPPAVLDGSGNLDPRKIKMATSYLKETKHALDPEKSATITVTLPEKGKSLGITFNSDETYGFPVLTKVVQLHLFEHRYPWICNAIVGLLQ